MYSLYRWVWELYVNSSAKNTDFFWKDDLYCFVELFTVWDLLVTKPDFLFLIAKPDFRQIFQIQCDNFCTVNFLMKCPSPNFEEQSQCLHLSTYPNWEKYFWAFCPGSILLNFYIFFLLHHKTFLFHMIFPCYIFPCLVNCETSSYYSIEH